MKITKLILFFTIARYCFSQTDICAKKFEEELESKCKAIDKDNSCELTIYTPRCISSNNNDCSKGNNDQTYCLTLFPKSFPEYICTYNSGKCEETPISCTDFNGLINGVDFRENKTLCKSFVARNNKKECRLDNGGTCKSFYKNCEDIKLTDFSSSPSSFALECRNNLPSEYNYQCDLNLAGTECVKVERKCDVQLKNIDEDNCHRLNPADTNKQKCVYSGGICMQQIIDCKDKSICDGHPLKGSGNNYNFDYTNECGYNDEYECVEKPITCEDYSGNDASICTQHIAKNPNIKRCFFDESMTKCIEMYNECADYNNNNQITTNRAGCEGIIPETNPTDKCVYITEEDKCVRSSTIEKECNAYEGKSKKMCELITLFPTTRDYCILDKDSTCKEKPLECSQAIGEKDCLNIAKANDENKRCAYNKVNKKCYEEYIRCEDFIKNNQVSNPFTSGSTYCSGIKLYNGMKCEEDTTTGRCRSIFKTCEEAENEDECKLIAKTGVSNPERKVCDYVDYDEPSTSPTKKCREIYKYCTDYRGINQNFCQQIKPYNDDGDKIDNKFKCKYETNIGCQRIPVECSDAKNPTVCNEFSDYIKDSDKKHCVFYDGICKEFYRTCEDVESVNSDCQNNIIEGNLKHVCEVNSNGECVRAKNCRLFISQGDTDADKYYKELCQSINPNCSYNNNKCEYKENSCSTIIFYPDFSTDDEQKKQKCENMTASKNYNKCVLKEDKSGCMEVYRELSYSSSYYSNTNPPDNTPQESSSDSVKKGIHLIIILLSLLF